MDGQPARRPAAGDPARTPPATLEQPAAGEHGHGHAHDAAHAVAVAHADAAAAGPVRRDDDAGSAIPYEWRPAAEQRDEHGSTYGEELLAVRGRRAGIY